jgi:hypothetical protein
MQVFGFVDGLLKQFTVAALIGVRDGVQGLVKIAHEMDQEAESVWIAPGGIGVGVGGFELSGEEADAGGDAIVVGATFGDVGAAVLQSEIEEVPAAGAGIFFDFVGPKRRGGHGVGDGFGRVVNFEYFGDAGQGGGSEMTNGDAGDHFMAFLPPALGLERKKQEKDAENG